MTSHHSPLAPAQSSPNTNVRSAIADGIALLERELVPSPSLAAELLLMHALERDRAWIYAHPELELGTTTRDLYFTLISKRASGIPTQYLTGHQEFWGLEFEVTPAVLIPRPETEHVIEVALEHLGVASDAGSPRRKENFRIADIGTGSGCIAIALAHELPNAHFIATDISAAALEVARRNAARHGVNSRIEFVECNLADFLIHGTPLLPVWGKRITGRPSPPLRASGPRSLDLIASNPPYIGRKDLETLPREVRDHEPEQALFGGEAGTEIYAPLVAQAATLLKPGGSLVLELSHDSAEQVSRLLDAPEWTSIVISNDLAGIPRVVSARRNSD